MNDHKFVLPKKTRKRKRSEYGRTLSVKRLKGIREKKLMKTQKKNDKEA